MAVAKLFDLDWTAHTIGHDDGMDMWFEDCSIDVKTGFENARMLLFRTQEKFKADVAIFCRQSVLRMKVLKLLDGLMQKILNSNRKNGFRTW